MGRSYIAQSKKLRQVAMFVQLSVNPISVAISEHLGPHCNVAISEHLGAHCDGRSAIPICQADARNIVICEVYSEQTFEHVFSEPYGPLPAFCCVQNAFLRIHLVVGIKAGTDIRWANSLMTK